MSAPENVTQLLARWADGDRSAFDRLLPLLYDDLLAIARNHLVRERADHTLNTQALVHESYLNLVGGAEVHWRDRGHFFAVASRAMRHVLIDYARKKKAEKRGGNRVRVTLDPNLSIASEGLDRLLAIDEALRGLATHDERLASVVECRFFGGLNAEDTGRALGVSLRTVERDWTKARAYLKQALDEPF